MRNSLRAKEGAADAELALKAYVLLSNPELLAEVSDGDKMKQEIAGSVDLTEAPEDAVCSLVIDLMKYCEREKIDWTQDVRLRARNYIRNGQAPPIRN
jgi:hypothetical protein